MLNRVLILVAIEHARAMVVRHHETGALTPLSTDHLGFLINRAKVVGGWTIATDYGRMLGTAAAHGR